MKSDTFITKDQKGNLVIFGEVIHQCPPEFVTKEEIESLMIKLQTFNRLHEEVEKARHEWVAEECRIRDLVGQRMYQTRLQNHRKLGDEIQKLTEVAD